MSGTARPGFRPRTLAVAVLLLGTLAALPTPASQNSQPLRLAAAPATAPVTIGTVPSVPGFPVTVDGVTELTDEAGKAHFDDVPVGSALAGHVVLTDATVAIGGRQVQVSADRLYPFPAGPQLALDLSYPVLFQFSGPESGPHIDAVPIEKLTVKSSTGAVAELPAQQGGWLQGSRVVLTHTGLQVKDVEWRVQRVEVAGSNVVNTSQQRFLPAQQSTVDVELLFFSLNLRVHDAVYGFPHGGAVELVYPDGQAHRFTLEPDGELIVPALPRGDYSLTILGSGPKMPRPLAVSRDQDVDMSFYSWLDVATVLGVLLGLAVGLAWWGRRRRRQGSASIVPGPGVEETQKVKDAVQVREAVVVQDAVHVQEAVVEDAVDVEEVVVQSTRDAAESRRAEVGAEADGHPGSPPPEEPSDLVVVPDRRTP